MSRTDADHMHKKKPILCSNTCIKYAFYVALAVTILAGTVNPQPEKTITLLAIGVAFLVLRAGPGKS